MLAVTLLTAAHAPVLANTRPAAGLTERSAAGLPDLPVALPSMRAQAAGSGTVAVGQQTTIHWTDERFDDSLQKYVTVLGLKNAVEGSGYRLTLAGIGPISAFIVDAEGDPVAYAEHPDAAAAPPTLEWEFLAGDQIVLISDPLPLAAESATLWITEFADARAPLVADEALLPEGPTLSGELDATDPHLPFHGGHFDHRWTKPVTAARGQDEFVLTFAGSTAQTDWLSVVVLDADQLPVRETPVKSGSAALSLAEGESFVVTSFAPDDFGSYAFEWMLLGQPEISGVGDPSWWDLTLTSTPGYQVSWRWSSQIPPRSSWAFEPSKLRHRVEVSTDGRTRSRAVVERPNTDVLDHATRIVLKDGSYRLRVVVEIGAAHEVSRDVAFQATGDAGGWRITSLRIAQPPRLVPTPGSEPARFDFSNIAVATEVYRDGRTRTRRLPTPPIIMFQFSTGEWRLMAGEISVVTLPDSGHVRIETSNGRVRSNAYPVTLPKALDAYRSAIAPPTRSPHVGGAMVFSGHVSRQYSDAWRPVVDRRPYRIQHRSGSHWVTVFKGRVKAGGKGEIQATVPLPGKGVYRLVIGGTSVATWQLTPASPTKTAKVAR